MASKIRRHSRIIDELPQELKQEIDNLLVQGDVTYDDIKEHLAAKGHDISRSSIGRYGKEFFANYRELRIIEEKSRTLVSEAGDSMILDEAASKLFAQKILELQLAGKFDLKKNSRILADFAKLQAASIMRERMKQDFVKKTTAAAADVVKIVKKGGLSEDKAEEIRKRILGIV
jgi:hypothetical protein